MEVMQVIIFCVYIHYSAFSRIALTLEPLPNWPGAASACLECYKTVCSYCVLRDVNSIILLFRAVGRKF